MLTATVATSGASLAAASAFSSRAQLAGVSTCHSEANEQGGTVGVLGNAQRGRLPRELPRLKRFGLCQAKPEQPHAWCAHKAVLGWKRRSMQATPKPCPRRTQATHKAVLGWKRRSMQATPKPHPSRTQALHTPHARHTQASPKPNQSLAHATPTPHLGVCVAKHSCTRHKSLPVASTHLHTRRERRAAGNAEVTNVAEVASDDGQRHQLRAAASRRRAEAGCEDQKTQGQGVGIKRGRVRVWGSKEAGTGCGDQKGQRQGGEGEGAGIEVARERVQGLKGEGEAAGIEEGRERLQGLKGEGEAAGIEEGRER
eukprot:358557-Chlamydomonas_euryale.AAC.2